MESNDGIGAFSATLYLISSTAREISPMYTRPSGSASGNTCLGRICDLICGLALVYRQIPQILVTLQSKHIASK